MADTLLLDRDAWDLCLDAGGNIARASDPYSQVQDVASACRLFQGEAYYNTTLGIPYFQQVLGHFQPIQVIKAFLEKEALTVPGVATATALLSGLAGRELRGQIQITTSAGAVAVAIL